MASRSDPTIKASSKPRTPEMATQAAGISHPYLEVTPPFYLVFHPNRWTVLDGKLVPALQRVPLAAGVNGIEVDGGGRIRFARVRAQLESEGRMVVPYDWAPDGESYLQCLDTRPNGSKDVAETWITVFETAGAGARKTSPGEAAYAAWLTKLISDGKLSTCPLAIANEKLDRASDRLEVARADAAKLGGHGRASIRARALEAEVKVLEDYVNGLQGEKAKVKTKRTPTVEDRGEVAS